MSAVAAKRETAGLTLPALLLVGLLGVVGWQTGVVRLPAFAGAAFMPEMVTIAPRAYLFRDSGEFLRDGASVDGPLVRVETPNPLDIMAYQVSAADYQRCVADAACRKAEPRRRSTGNVPVTGISYHDAIAYAAWLSARTGETWRLPTISEWAFAAGGKASDQALGIATDATNPAERWIAAYEKEAAEGSGTPDEPLPLGSVGSNEFGVSDLSGAVWEWTATCASRTTLGPNDAVLSRIESCGVHYLEGRHRTGMSVFIRDAAAGGCSIGVPPDNLGFRLVRDRGWFAGATDALRGLFA